MGFLEVERPVLVTLRNVDWFGEQVKEQKKLTKFAQHAGQTETIGLTIFVDATKSSTWSWLQHALESSYAGPHVDTNSSRSSASGYKKIAVKRYIKRLCEMMDTGYVI